ncbi:MAG: hypothetical protein HYZ37_18965 [Candidatus Solibacter usitatus]|nr:hypothetical protein [Candidatus Solibacter usitatus]
MKPISAFLIAASLLTAAESNAQKQTLSFSDPAAAKRLEVSLVNGSITVKTHAAKEAIIEGNVAATQRKQPPPGMKRLDTGLPGLGSEQTGNTIKLHAIHKANVTIWVPAETALKLNTINGGDIIVEGIAGEIDTNNINGNITLTDVSGPVVAHALNGKLTVSLSKLDSGKAMSLSTFNKDVDLTLPADAKASVKLKSQNGEIFTDFDVTLKGAPVVEESKKEPPASNKNSSPRTRTRTVRFEKVSYGTINGGGQEIQLTTYNGSIYIRKKK